MGTAQGIAAGPVNLSIMRVPAAIKNGHRSQCPGEQPDSTAPIEYRAAGRERLGLPLFEIGLVTFFTVVFFAQGGHRHVLGSGQRTAIEGVLLLLFWAVALAHLWYVLRYTVRLDEQGVSVFHGFRSRMVRWDEAFIAEWRTKTYDDDDGGTYIRWTLEIRDAAGTVRLRIDGNLLERYRDQLERRINAELRSHRTRLQQADEE